MPRAALICSTLSSMPPPPLPRVGEAALPLLAALEGERSSMLERPLCSAFAVRFARLAKTLAPCVSNAAFCLGATHSTCPLCRWTALTRPHLRHQARGHSTTER
eukprot:7296600-Prymnesium_polylepis.1